MAEYVDDSGAHGYDALLAGTKGVEYDYNTTDKTLTMEVAGSASSNFNLPNSEWLVYEVYNVGNLGSNVLGKQEWTASIGTLATMLSTWMTDVRTAYTGKTFDVKATHYKGNDRADVYIGSDVINFPATPDIEDGAYTGYNIEWIISDTLLADGVADGFIIYISYNKDTDPAGDEPQDGSNVTIDWPVGTIGNDFLPAQSGDATEYVLQDINGNTTGVKLRNDSTWSYESKANVGDEGTDALTKHQMVNTWVSTGNTRTQSIYLPIGTYDIKVSAASGVIATNQHVLNGNIYRTLVMADLPQTASADFDGFVVTIAGWFSLETNISSGDTARIGGMNITKIA